MKPIFKINNIDFTEHIAEDGMKPSINDLDADGSGRNLLNGLMHRRRIASKDKRTVEFMDLDEKVMQNLMNALYEKGDYVDITMLDPKLNRHVTRSYYFSTINQGVQKYRGGHTIYTGVTFNITER